MKKSATSSVQYDPIILVNRERIPQIERDKSFIYLAKQFDHRMKIENIKEQLKTDNINYITTIDRLPLNALNKITVIQQYVYSKYRWLFSSMCTANTVGCSAVCVQQIPLVVRQYVYSKYRWLFTNDLSVT